MRAVRDFVLGSKRRISVKGMEEVEVAFRKLVREEAAAWRGCRRRLAFW